MKKIGLLVAVEMDAVLTRYGAPQETQQVDGFEVLRYENESYTVFAVNAGAGEIAAAAATQPLSRTAQIRTNVSACFSIVTVIPSSDFHTESSAAASCERSGSLLFSGVRITCHAASHTGPDAGGLFIFLARPGGCRRLLPFLPFRPSPGAYRTKTPDPHRLPRVGTRGLPARRRFPPGPCRQSMPD